MTVIALHAVAVFDAGPKDIGLMFSAIAATQVIGALRTIPDSSYKANTPLATQ